jgi:hypothetical protein
MAETALSWAETALENQRIGGLQIRVATIGALVSVLDTWDVNAISVSVPQLTHLWHLPGPAFTGTFLWSSIGIMVGALSAGPIGDRWGRKPLLVLALTVAGLASLATAFAGSIATLTILRFFTGVGVGGSFPTLVFVVALWLPESPRSLARRAILSSHEQALLQRLDITPAQGSLAGLDVPDTNTVAMLFGKGYALQTVLLWIILSAVR